MTFQEYQINATRTCPHIGQNNMRHMKSGIFTECGELIDVCKKYIAYGKEIDIIHIKEELGDICWYVSGYKTFNNLHFYKPISNTKFESVEQIVDVFLNYSYGEGLKLNQLMAHVCGVCDFFELDIENVLEININKLKARYPEKFTQENALNRDLNQERKILEQ